MTILAEDATDVQDELNPELKNDLKSDWRKFSPAFARKLNPDRPDYGASVLMNELILWTKTKDKSRRCRQAECYRSLSQLAVDCPSISGGIEECLARLEAKLGQKFTAAPTSECHWFTIDPKLIKEYQHDKGLWFKKRVAGPHGILKAVLLANLEFQVRLGRTCEIDPNGNRFGELSPRKLTKPDIADRTVLPWSERQIKRALKEMRTEDELLVQHPTKKTLYAVADGFVYVGKNDNRRVTETEGRVTQTETWVTETDTFPGTEVIRSNLGIKYHSLHDQASAAPSLARADESKIPERLKTLMRLTKEDLSKSTGRSSARVSNAILPYDYFEANEDDLPYDVVSFKQSGIITLRSQEITEAVNSIKTNWRIFKLPYTKEDIGKLTSLFVDNPAFQVEHWERIEAAIVEAQFQPPVKRGHWDNESILRRVKTAKARLQYLPQIIHQMFLQTGYVKHSPMDKDSPRDFEIEGAVPEPYVSLDCSCLGSYENSSLVGNESPFALQHFFGHLPSGPDYDPSVPDYLEKVRGLKGRLIKMGYAA